VVLTANVLISMAVLPGPDESVAKEAMMLEGTWADDPPKGDGRRNIIRFESGSLEWRSVRYRNGKPLFGQAIVYENRLDATSKPKEITLTGSATEAKETLLGIYELDGDKLKIALGNGKMKPSKFDDKSADVLTLKRVKQ